MTIIKNILLKLATILLIVHCSLLISSSVHAETVNLGWATDAAREVFVGNLRDDVAAFAPKPLVADFVPVEARVGRAFIGAMSMIADVLESSLVRFVVGFLIALFSMWTMLEAYQMMRDGKNASKLVESIIKKAILIAVWIAILQIGPAKLFMMIMGPIVAVGTYLSDLILNSVTTVIGAKLPDTCAAIHGYVAANTSGTEILDAASTANLLCVPTRMSGFFYTAVAAGWQWMVAGIGQSVFMFMAGLVFVVIFIYNAFNFALMALGVIADLFLGLMMLPFTAIAMTFGETEDKTYFGEKGATSYAGIAGNIFNQFLKLFTTETLSKQVERFVNAAIYFVSLSAIVALCAAILSGVVDLNFVNGAPVLTDDDFMTTLIVGCLVAYLANKSGEFAKRIGGSINDEYTKQISGDVKTLWKNTTKQIADWRKAIKKK